MADETRVLRPPGGRSSSWWGASLPPEILARSRHRIARVALLMVGMSGIAVIAAWLLPASAFPRSEVVVPIIILHGFSLALPAALYAVARAQRFSNEAVLTLGLVFVVLLCAVISLAMPWFMYFNYGYVPQLTWTTLLIAVYPLLVPSTVTRIAASAVIAVATVPLGVFILDTFGAVEVEPSLYAVVTIHPSIAAIIAVFGSRVVHGLTLEAARAQRVGSYQLEERLGAGGMGEVWRARHAMLARPAAIKLVRREMLGGTAEQAMQRFDREAQVTATLDSPHTIRVYDYGTTDDGNVYYVMELLEGMDLDTIVGEFGPLPAERVVYILFQICDSLAEAHHKGLVHRDIKPANVYLCRQAMWDDFVKVLDFGLVGVANADEDARLTMDGFLNGTPAYMAPEVAEGAVDVDARTDIYAVGCVAYWLLTGRAVFVRDSMMKVIMAHARDEPEPPSAHSELEVPTELERIILDCLEKDPAKRPAGAVQLSQRLAKVELANPWTPERAERWWDKHRPRSGTDTLP